MTTLKCNAKKSFIAGALVLSQTVWLTPLPVLADNSVRLAGQQIFAVNGGTTPAQTVQNNLDNALVAATDKTPAAVNITYVNGVPVVTLGGYQVVTVDAATAKAAGTTPAVLAKQWADSIRSSLTDQTSVNSYVAQLSGSYASSAPAAAPAAPTSAYQEPANFNLRPQTPQGNAMGGPDGGQGYGGQAQYGGPQGYGGQQQYANAGGGPMYQGSVAYAPAGLVLPISLQTSISTQVAKSGDIIQAMLSQTMMLGNAQIPQGSVLTGTITDAEAGRRLSRSGELSIKFNSLRTPEGVQVPISAHLVGGIGKYTGQGSEEAMRGEGWKAKVGQTALRGLGGAAGGAALGTGLGAITGGLSGSRSVGMSTGMGAAFGAAMGGGVGMGSMLLRKGRDVVIPSGTNMQLQLDAPVTIGGGGGGGNLAGGPGAPRYGGGL